MRGEIGIYVQLTDPCCDVKQKAEPAHPVEKLHFADFATLGRQSTNRLEYFTKEAEDPRIGLGRGPFKTWITFADVERSNENGTAERETGDDTENFELCIAKPGKNLWELHVAGEVSKNVANASDPASPRIGVLLLVRWGIVNYEGADACLNLEDVSGIHEEA